MKKSLTIFIIVILVLAGIYIFRKYRSEETMLKAMNNNEMPFYLNLSNNKTGNAFKVVVIGNSLALHGISEEVGWYTLSGMAASAPQKDYVHLLLNKTDSLLVDRKVIFKVTNLSAFERDFNNYSPSNLDSIRILNPDLIIFQIGDNVSFVSEDDKEKFEDKFKALIGYVRGNSKVICASPFFTTEDKAEAIKNVSASTNSTFVDLSDMAGNPQYKAGEEEGYTGDRTKWKVPGVAIHPGDKGMSVIASRIFKAYSQQQ